MRSAHAVRNGGRVPRGGRAGRRGGGGSARPHHSSMSGEEEEMRSDGTAPSGFPSDGPAGRGGTHPDLDRDLPSGLQSWSKGCRCLRQKFR